VGLYTEVFDAIIPTKFPAFTNLLSLHLAKFLMVFSLVYVCHHRTAGLPS